MCWRCVDEGLIRRGELILAMSGRLTTPELAREIIDAWLSVEKPDESQRENIERLKRLDEEVR
jgi:ribose 5-phosphate isomerase B